MYHEHAHMLWNKALDFGELACHHTMPMLRICSFCFGREIHNMNAFYLQLPITLWILSIINCNTNLKEQTLLHFLAPLFWLNLLTVKLNKETD